ncbi:DUF2247 family protein [Sporosarcina sp. P1]|uniref:DUF2247 family protein n=1 Tax=Sporosarcina sp. P1 TaxID=2048257 RepID=UPI000C165F32|nr:DUF2247 family protein [Sporosarcina sp. P1]PIC82956.1 hypothetical protein CSV73_09520 [Sporosarcina sp. P1]
MSGENQTNNIVENSLLIVVPYEFVISKTDLSWKELYFGTKCGFIKPDAAIEKAVKLISQEEKISTSLVDLGSLFKHEVSLVEPYLVELADQEPVQDINNIKEKWLYLILSWLFKHKEQYTILHAEVPYLLHDSYEKVSVIWEDFDRPVVLEDLFGEKYINAPTYFIINNESRDLTNFDELWESFLNTQEKRFLSAPIL